jgi:uncharacterized damage-inducible protein DinB
MKNYCIDNLNEIKALLELLPESRYQQPSNILSGATIGQHVRHILEFYVCMLRGSESGQVNYDERERNHKIENHSRIAIGVIDEITEKLHAVSEDCEVLLVGNYGTSEGMVCQIHSSLYRELAYNLEHAIHHQALIKVGLKEAGHEHLISADFGVAPATLRFTNGKALSA